MTRDEHLYTVAAEECAELAQRFSKANRFGCEEVQPGQELSNRQRILYEFADLVGVMEMLGFFPFGLRTGPSDALRPEIDAKKAKVEKFLAYSAKCGTLKLEDHADAD